MTTRYASSATQELPRVDVAMITALQSELDPLLDLLGGREAWGKPHLIDGVSHYVTEVPTEHGPLRIVVATAAHPGGDYTSAAVARAVRFQPYLIALAGCCAGRKGKTHLGDVIVPEWSFDPHEGGKNTEQGFQPAGETTPPISRKPLIWAEEFRAEQAWARAISTPNPELTIVQLLCRLYNVRLGGRAVALHNADEDTRLALDWLREQNLINATGEITAAGEAWRLKRSVSDRGRRRAKKIARLPAVHIGPAVQWIAVEAHPEAYREAMGQARKVLMGENESKSFFQAAREHDVAALVAKGVVDYADGAKNDLYHRYGKEASVRWLLALLSTYADRIRGLPTKFGADNRLTSTDGRAPPITPTASQIGLGRVSPDYSSRVTRMVSDYTKVFGGRAAELRALDTWLDDEAHPFGFLHAPTAAARQRC